MERVEKFREWQKIRGFQPLYEEPEILAGRNAEDFLMRMVKSNLFLKNGACFHSKRVPCKSLQRRFEIDVIVLTHKKIHVIEVKNWSGELDIQGGEFFQIRRDGSHINHGNLLRLQTQKQDALLEYFHGAGCQIQPEFLTSNLLFMNERLKFASAVKRERAIIFPNQIAGFLQGQTTSSYAERFLQAILEVCLRLDEEEARILNRELFGSVPDAEYQRCKSALENLKTFDKITYYGGKIVAGDAYSMQIDGKISDLKEMPSDTSIAINWSRGIFNGLFRVLWGKNSMGEICFPGNKLPVTAADTLLFHAAGDKNPARISLGQIEKIIKG